MKLICINKTNKITRPPYIVLRCIGNTITNLHALGINQPINQNQNQIIY